MNMSNQQKYGEKYNFCYQQCLPNTLTINKKPKQVLKHLYKLATYVWINVQGQNIYPQVLQQKSEVPICFVTSLKEVKQKYQNENNLILISPISLIKRIYFTLKPMIKTFKIIRLLFYGKTQQMVDYGKFINSSYFNSIEKVVDQIRQQKYIYAQPNYSNFISIQHSNNYTKAMIAILNQETCVNQIMQQFKQLALMSFSDFQQSIQTFVYLYKEKDRLDEKQAIKWFIKQSFLYRFMSLILKTTSQLTSLLIIQPYFRDLFKAIHHTYKKQQSQQYFEYENQTKSYKKFTCYRGAYISEDQIKFFKQNTNKCVQNLSFLSTSRNYNIATNFRKNAIIQIQVEDELRNLELDYGFCDVSQYSPLHQNQEEILFNHLNSFKILDIREECTFNQLWKVRLKYGQLARIAILQNKQLTTYQLQCKQRAEYQIKLIKQHPKFSDILIENNLPGCQEFCNKFIEIAENSKNLDHITNAHYMKAHIAKNKQDYKTMQIQYEKCLQLIQNGKNNDEIICKLDNLVGRSNTKYLQKCQSLQKQSQLKITPTSLSQ